MCGCLVGAEPASGALRRAVAAWEAARRLWWAVVGSVGGKR